MAEPFHEPDRKLRMPATVVEANRVFVQWDALNDRYYVAAHVVFADGLIVSRVLFDGDSGIAVWLNGKNVADQPEFLQRPIAHLLVTDSATASYPCASHDERARYMQRYGLDVIDP